MRMYPMVRRETVTCFPRAAALAAAFLVSMHASAQQSVEMPTAQPPLSPALHRDADIYGWQLMTHQERYAYRERMRAVVTDEERARVLAEHQATMQARARERNVALPSIPPPSSRAAAASRDGVTAGSRGGVAAAPGGSSSSGAGAGAGDGSGGGAGGGGAGGGGGSGGGGSGGGGSGGGGSGGGGSGGGK